jgi:hypothetical protein
LSSLVSGGDRPVAICLRPDDLGATAERLQLDVTEGMRSNHGDVTLRLRMAGRRRLSARIGDSCR